MSSERATDMAAGPALPCAAGKLSGRSRLLAWVAIVAVFAALRVPFVSTPLERDEGTYAYVARQALRGDVPYRDAFDHKPPGIYLIYAAVFLTAGESVEGIHLGMYGMTLAAMVVLYRLVSRRFGEGAGLGAALTLAVAAIDRSVFGSAANTEIFMIVPLTGALLCLLPPGGAPTKWRLLSAGALAAAGFWLKPVAATNVVFLAIWVAYRSLDGPRRRGAARVSGRLGWLALGGAAATAPVVAYFALHGAWEPFVDCVFSFNSHYATVSAPPLRLAPSLFWAAFRTTVAPLWPVYALASVGGAALLRGERRDRVLLLGWLVFSFAGVCVGGYFRRHYLIQLLPAVSALAGLGIVRLLAWTAGGRFARFTRAACLAILLVLVTVPVIANRAVIFARSPDVQARLIYGLNPFDYSRAIADEVRRGSGPAEKVLVIGSEPEILFYADRRSATRYIYLSPLAAMPGRRVQGELAATLSDVRQSRPRIAVDLTRLPIPQLAGPVEDADFFGALSGELRSLGLRPASFYQRIPTAMLGPRGETYRVVDPATVLEWEDTNRARVTGAMVLRRPDAPLGSVPTP